MQEQEQQQKGWLGRIYDCKSEEEEKDLLQAVLNLSAEELFFFTKNY